MVKEVNDVVKNAVAFL